MCCRMIEVSSVLIRTSSDIFGNLRIFQNMFGNVCLAFGEFSENLLKSSKRLLLVNTRIHNAAQCRYGISLS